MSLAPNFSECLANHGCAADTTLNSVKLAAPNYKKHTVVGTC